ncbi:MAG: hypothetical protein WCS98_08135 [Bacillota bacterium]|nr:hypothetical protein [Bacillota bacterium]MDD3298584.1 hypothetical protein [Bacillota bacterium]MDD3851558.1 hypothetical protein [Bacillota bacterium]MDD4708094.1 hypothetical protein [Bacillota bacterium]
MIFIRMSSRLLFLRTAQHKRLEEYLINCLDSRTITMENALKEASEDSTLVFIMPIGLQATSIDDALSILHTPYSSSVILMRILNEGKTGLLKKAQLGPGLLIMRIPEEGQSIIERMKEEYSGNLLSFDKGISRGQSEDTLIAFTSKPINRYIADDQENLPFLLVNMPVTQMQRNIRRDAVRYMTESLKDTQWYEYRINIYDAYNNYMQHLERLMLALSDLELGFTLGQQWTRDHALVLYSVTAYQVRIFSLLPPYRIKKLLIGLEFNSQGQRFVDMDLYYRNKKVEFNSLDVQTRKQGRAKIAADMREEIIAGLSKETLKRFLDIEGNLAKKDKNTNVTI